MLGVGVGNFGKSELESDILPPIPQPCTEPHRFRNTPHRRTVQKQVQWLAIFKAGTEVKDHTTWCLLKQRNTYATQYNTPHKLVILNEKRVEICKNSSGF